MSSKHLHLKDSGIFKNLPNFSPDIKGLTAIIMGTTGISGFHAMRVLLESPHRWKEVYAHPLQDDGPYARRAPLSRPACGLRLPVHARRHRQGYGGHLDFQAVSQLAESFLSGLHEE
jgi:hypothetical protein